MIASLRGAVVERSSGLAVVDVGGVGYAVRMGTRQLEALPPEGEVLLSIHTVVRGDDISLFGFFNSIERDAFKVLLGVSGVGPKAALALMGSLELEALSRAVESEDITLISKAPGIGPKTARRLALELKGKLPVAFEPTSTAGTAATASPSNALSLALAQLGYRRTEIVAAQAAIAEQGLEGEALERQLSAALAALSGGGR